jgi:hypothetical protein
VLSHRIVPHDVIPCGHVKPPQHCQHGHTAVLQLHRAKLQDLLLASGYDAGWVGNPEVLRDHGISIVYGYLVIKRGGKIHVLKRNFQK